VKIDMAGVIRGLVIDQEKNEIQILIESVVHADTIPELKFQEEEGQKSESATLINWLTINPTLGIFILHLV